MQTYGMILVACAGAMLAVDSTVHHYEYVFPDGNIDVYDTDNNFALLTSSPGLTRHSRNQTGPESKSWSFCQSAYKVQWILLADDTSKNILPERSKNL
jgi:hypothetical protein